MHGVAVSKIQLRLIWELQRKGYQLGAAPQDGFLYFVKVWGGAFGMGHMISVFLEETDDMLSVSFNVNAPQAIYGMQRRDIQETVLAGEEGQIQREMFITDFILDIIGKACYEAADARQDKCEIRIGYRTFREPLVCPNCGTVCGTDFKVENDECREDIIHNEREYQYSQTFTKEELGTLKISGKKVKDHMVENESYERIILCEGIEEIGWQGIARCDRITELEIPSTVRHIGYLFCCDCRQLRKVRFMGPCPTGMERAFDDCWKLEEISVPRKYLEDYRKIFGKQEIGSKINKIEHKYKLVAW